MNDRLFDNNSDNDNLIEETNKDFPSCNHVCRQNVASEYILHLSTTCDTTPHVASCLTDYTIGIHQLVNSQIVKLAQLKEHKNKLVGCKFVSDNNQLLYTASNDGNIKLWDLRTLDKSIINFKDKHNLTLNGAKDLLNNITAFDTSVCNRLLASGTELVANDAYIFFWDIRNPNFLGAYWESHTDDITQLKFHPYDSNKLISGSTDGLINVYNLTEASEDDALELSLNTNEHVENLSWFEEKSKSKISCITSNVDLQLWEVDGAEPYKHIKREEVSKHIKVHSNVEDTYLVNTYYHNNFVWVIAGSGKQGNTLRSFCISPKYESAGFKFKENFQRVRTSCYNDNINLLFTGGENGDIDIWKPNFNDLELVSK